MNRTLSAITVSLISITNSALGTREEGWGESYLRKNMEKKGFSDLEVKNVGVFIVFEPNSLIMMKKKMSSSSIKGSAVT
jgi:hypothetical protein